MSKKEYYCIINGEIYNLKKIQDVINKNPQHPNYGEIYLLSIEEYNLPQSNLLAEVIKFNNNEIPADYNECLERMREYNSQSHSTKPTIKCPYCSSTNVQKISTTAKVANTVLFGIFGTKRHKQFHCNNCGADF